MAATLQVYQGDALPVSLLLKDSDGDAFDLTGYSAELQAKWGESDVEDLEVLEDDDLTLGGVAGTITGKFSGSQTDNFPEGKRIKLFLRLTEPDGDIKTHMIARVKVKNDE
jgi:hypothetical protein